MAHAIEPFLDETCEPRVRGFLHRPVSPRRRCSGADARRGRKLPVALAAGGCGSVCRMWNDGTALRPAVSPDAPARAAGCGQRGARSRRIAASGDGDAENRRRASVSRRTLLWRAPGHHAGRRRPGRGRRAIAVLSYPLHPPRRPTQLRTAHFPRLRVPSLFVQGTRDEFASVEEITSALELIPARTRLLVIEGAGHSLAGRGELPAVTAKVSSAFREFIG